MNQVELRLVVPPHTTTNAPVLQYRQRQPLYETGPYCPGEWGPWVTVPVVVEGGAKV
jgi:hypothetical protein